MSSETEHGITGSWSLYLFDPEDTQWRRPWKAMLPRGFREVSIVDAHFRHASGEARDGIVVVHASRLPEERIQSRLLGNARKSNLHLVLISGGHQPGPPEEDGLYRRRCPVGVQELDDGFRACFARFWDHLQRTGDICCQLLEPAKQMIQVLAVLCQGYLLAHVDGTCRLELPDAGDETTERASEAVKRLGLDEAMASAELSSSTAEMLGNDGMTRTVRRRDWWSPVDADQLRRELALSGVEDPVLLELVDEIGSAGPINPSTVVGAYCALEGHLPSGLRTEQPH